MRWRLIWLAALVLAAPAGAADSDGAALDRLEDGIAQFKDNDLAGARAAFIRARDLAPNRPNPHRWLAMTDVRLGRCHEALRELDAFLRLVPRDDPRTVEAITLRDRCQAELRDHPDSPPGGGTAPPVDEEPMVRIPAGCFSMGAADGVSDEQPAHSVCLAAFDLDRHEVTNQQYRQCMEAGVCPNLTTGYAQLSGGPYSEPRQPVVAVEWSSANSYCNFVGKSLPSEAQWEYAARGSDGRIYPWGNTIDCGAARFGAFPGDCSEKPWCAEASRCRGPRVTRPAPVESYPRDLSPFGVRDLGGNVAEWVEDAGGPFKIVRGGSWGSEAKKARASHRRQASPAQTSSEIGFRCARAVPGSSPPPGVK